MLSASIDAARAGFPARGGGKRTVAARAKVARLLWNEDGSRRVPALTALDRALAELPKGELSWMTELSELGPIYLFPTRPFLRALAAQIRSLGVTRVLEVAAGDGHLSRALAREAPDLEISASDSGAWEIPAARMSAKEQRVHRRSHLAGITLGNGVHRLDAERAIRKLRPELVLASWIPPGPLLSKLIRAPAKFLLEIGAGSGITGDLSCWRFAHEFLEGPLERLARCRLDERPQRALHSKLTLYFARRHPEFFEERIDRDHWLWNHRLQP